MKSYDVYIGIDVAKQSLELSAFDAKPREIANTKPGIERLIKRIKALDQSVMVCCEATGGYEKKLAAQLLESEVPIAVVNPRLVRDFSKSKGFLAKTDRIDALVIARFAEVHLPKTLEPTPRWRERLQEFITRRDELITMKKQEQNRLDPCPGSLAKKMIRAHIRFIERHIEKLDEQIAQLIETEGDARQIHDRLTQIKGVGTLSAAAFAAFVPELGTISAREAAALVGVAPYNNDSGAFRGKRRVMGGRKRIRKILYMAALAARTHNPTLKAFYEQLIARGKLPKVALTALIRKIVCLANRLIADPQFQLS